MTDPIVSRDTIRAKARAAVDTGQHFQSANPYPFGTAAHDRFISEYDEHLLVCLHVSLNDEKFALVD